MNKILSLLLGLMFFCDGFAQDISNGIPASVNYLRLHPEIKKIVYAFPTPDESEVVALTDFGSGDTYYALYDDLNIRVFNLATQTLIDEWPLNGYKDEAALAGEELVAAPFLAGAYNEEYTPFANLSELVVHDNVTYSLLSEFENAHGCLQQYPLRYADVENDGSPELLLYFGYHFVIASPRLKKVVFSTAWIFTDELSVEEKADYGVERLDANAPQFVAASGLDNMVDRVLPSRKSFAKLYYGDFDNNGEFDILVWRKLYESRLINDPVKGYMKKGEMLLHYALKDGVYHIQGTKSDVVKSWIDEKKLTWRMGYPSVSECSGVEGDYIHEMDDPMLNDPDVML